MFSIKHCSLLFSTLGALILSETAYSSCTLDFGSVDEVAMISNPNLTINPDAPINSSLGFAGLILNALNGFTCTSPFFPRFESPLPSLGGDLFSSGVPGIGLRISHLTGGVRTNLPYTGPQETAFPSNYWGGLSVELVKVGVISSGGTVLPAHTIIARKTAPTHANIVMQTASLLTPITVTLASKPTCSVDSTSIAVNLGQVSMSDFDIEGRTPKEPFEITLTCSGGTAGASTGIFVTLTDQTAPGNRSTQLSLTPGSTATGLALEITNKFGLVSFGADSASPGNPGQWNQGSAGNGRFSIPLSVNYLKGATPPTPGTANAIATFTMSYQ